MLYRNASQTVSNSAGNRSPLTSNGHDRTSAGGKLQSRCHRGGPGARGPEPGCLLVLKRERDLFTLGSQFRRGDLAFLFDFFLNNF